MKLTNKSSQISLFTSTHLTPEERIKFGSFFTPEKLVNKVFDLVNPYIKKLGKQTIVLDSAAGFGAFLVSLRGTDYRAKDFDLTAYNFLKGILNPDKILFGNSLKNVHRSSLNIPQDAKLIMVGNPPYNDITSEFKNGEKGENICDKDLFDRDLGISFLRSYGKLNANVVCVLHPLSFLIKEANFKRLRDFKDNYQLKRGFIFPSSYFENTGLTRFPIVIGLYEKGSAGMDYNFIRNFEFEILDSAEKFKLSKYTTTDGYINKYPPRKNDQKTSDLNLYFYTFRDLNSLKRNAGFMDKQHYNGIVVNADNFYKYAYLFAVKKLFEPENMWLYGNLSPLVNKDILEKKKKFYVAYALKSNPVLKNAEVSLKKKISAFYGVDEDLNNLILLEQKIRPDIDQLLH